jgi:hypothetical protein
MSIRPPLFLLLLFFCCVSGVFAQSKTGNSRVGSPYLIPQTVYVGDRATLVVPLSPSERTVSESGGETGYRAALMPAEELPLSPNLVLHRIELERQGGNSRLLIDFSAYAPGVLELPPFEIGGSRFAGLRIEIASILAGRESAMVLSGPASPLAIPGTALLIYGTMTGVILLVLIFLGGIFWGRRHWAGWIERWKRRRLILSMMKIEGRVRRDLLRGRSDNYGELLNLLSAEFRSFLALFTGENCRAMTAGELGLLQVPVLYPEGNGKLKGDFLGGFFRRCDDLRFSGAKVVKDELLGFLGDTRLFLEDLNRAASGTFRQAHEKGEDPVPGGNP